MKYKHLAWALSLAALAGCAQENLLTPTAEEGDRTPINLGSHIDQQYTTRAGQDGFADGDKIGTFIVDYVDGKPCELLL